MITTARCMWCGRPLTAHEQPRAGERAQLGVRSRSICSTCAHKRYGVSSHPRPSLKDREPARG